eukprot:GFYU01012408.1.p1 GENE.GFYU01012408.1~~GFYU01012408.1.p1  ORF type:complete len:369 (-),score=67.81 GFYU01012408.1:114-1157(-)
MSQIPNPSSTPRGFSANEYDEARKRMSELRLETRLKSLQEKHSEELTLLQSQRESEKKSLLGEIEALKKAHEEKMNSLAKKHEHQIKSTRASHEAVISKMETRHERHINQIQADFQVQLGGVHDEHQKALDEKDTEYAGQLRRLDAVKRDAVGKTKESFGKQLEVEFAQLVARYEDKLVHSKNKYQKSIEQLRHQNRELTSVLRSCEVKINDLEELLKKSSDANDELKSSLVKYEDEVKTLVSECSEKDGKLTDLSNHYGRELDIVKAQIRSMQESMHYSQEQNNAYVERIQRDHHAQIESIEIQALAAVQAKDKQLELLRTNMNNCTQGLESTSASLRDFCSSLNV